MNTYGINCTDPKLLAKKNKNHLDIQKKVLIWGGLGGIIIEQLNGRNVESKKRGIFERAGKVD